MASWVRETQSEDISGCADTYRKNLFELFESVLNKLIQLQNDVTFYNFESVPGKAT